MNPVAIILLTVLACFVLYLVIRVSFWAFFSLADCIQDEGNNDLLRLLAVFPWLLTIPLVLFWSLLGIFCGLNLLVNAKKWWHHK
jgi:hypothetical protein